MPGLLVAELDALAAQSRYSIIDTLDSLSGFTTSGTVALDLVNYRSGGAGFKLTPAISGTAYADKLTGGGVNLAGVGLTDEIRWWLYVDNPAFVSSVTLRLYDTAGSPVLAEYTRTGAQLAAGWQRFSVPKSAFSNFSTFNWSSLGEYRFIAIANGSGSPNVTFDMLRLMIGPVIGYTNGRWNEANGLADAVNILNVSNGALMFFDNGYWELLDNRIKANDFTRLDSTSTGITVTLTAGSVRLSGIGGQFRLFELLLASWDQKRKVSREQPSYYLDSAIMDAIRATQGRHTSMFWAGIIDIFRQSYIKLATYMLPNIEKSIIGGDASSSGKSLAQRRLQMLQRYAAAFLPMNVKGMQKVVQFFVISATVTETPSTYSFAVQITSPKGVPPNLTDIQAAIERAKPAHLGYTITYTFTTWNAMDAYNRPWNTAELFTWDNFETS